MMGSASKLINGSLWLCSGNYPSATYWRPPEFHQRNYTRTHGSKSNWHLIVPRRWSTNGTTAINLDESILVGKQQPNGFVYVLSRGNNSLRTSLSDKSNQVGEWVKNWRNLRSVSKSLYSLLVAHDTLKHALVHHRSCPYHMFAQLLLLLLLL